MQKFILAIFMISSLSAYAATDNCPETQVIGKGVIASRFLTVALGCVVQITPIAKPELRYREYWIDDRGRLLVFVSVPGDDLDKDTGTRTYFLFPRRQIPSFVLNSNGDLSLTLSTGQTMLFGAEDAQPRSMPGQFELASDVTLDNQGGLEIQSFNGIRLDAGWTVGSQSYKNPIGVSVLSDAHNTKCTIKNDEFFFYENMYYGEPNLRYPDDSSLADFLKSRCPQLDLSPLGTRFSL